jgi:hypothetical protein
LGREKFDFYQDLRILLFLSFEACSGIHFC